MAMSTARWSELQTELLEVIASRAMENNVVDYIRFRAVCKSWQSISLRKPTSLPSHLPWLIVRSNEKNGSRFYVFCVFNNRFHPLHIPNITLKKYCSGASHGWLLFLDEESPEITLTNPITGDQILLPPATTLPPRTLGRGCGSCLQYIMLSSHPTLSNIDNCVALAVFNGCQLVFCKLGDTSWTTIKEEDNQDEDEWRRYITTTYCHGRFYVLDHYGRIVVCDLDTTCPTANTIDFPIKVPHLDCNYYYIFELSGELLLVITRHGNLPRIFKRDQGRQQWLIVKSLEDCRVFTSSGSSISLSSLEYSEIKGNCKYHSSAGIRHLEDNKFEQFEEWRNSNYLSDWDTFVWITPSLW